MSAIRQLKQNWCLNVLRSTEELERLCEVGEKQPDLFDLLVQDSSYKIYCNMVVSIKKVDRKGCKCSKSGCLKMYCQCLAHGMRCGTDCACTSCQNKAQISESEETSSSVPKKKELKRKCFEFSKYGKIAGTMKGCNCKRSGCQKRYCQCFSNGLKCTELCCCVGCSNCELPLLSLSTIDEDI